MPLTSITLIVIINSLNIFVLGNVKSTIELVKRENVGGEENGHFINKRSNNLTVSFKTLRIHIEMLLKTLLLISQVHQN